MIPSFRAENPQKGISEDREIHIITAYIVFHFLENYKGKMVIKGKTEQISDIYHENKQQKISCLCITACPAVHNMGGGGLYETNPVG